MALQLRTSRLMIEPLALDDIAPFVAYRRDPHVAQWQSWDTSYDEHDALMLIAGQPTTTDLPNRGDWVQLAIRDPDAGVLHGDVAVQVVADQPATFQIGITLAPSSQGKGLATEAITGVLRHLFERAGAHRALAWCDTRNEPVARVLVRVGMRHESRQVEADYVKGEWTTLDGYAVLAREYLTGSYSTRW